jgi:hypothetical protein
MCQTTLNNIIGRNVNIIKGGKHVSSEHLSEIFSTFSYFILLNVIWFHFLKTVVMENSIFF